MCAVFFVAREKGDQCPAPVVYADERSVAKDRPRDRMTLDREIGFDVADELEWIFAGTVALVDEREDRNSTLLTNLEELACSFFDSTSVVEKHDGAVCGDQSSVRVLREVFVTRSVEKIHVIAVVLELHDARRYRDAALLFELHPVRRSVTRCASRLDGAGKVNCPSVEEEFFSQGCLAGVRMADDRERAAKADCVFEVGHCPGALGRERTAS